MKDTFNQEKWDTLLESLDTQEMSLEDIAKEIFEMLDTLKSQTESAISGNDREWLGGTLEELRREIFYE